MLCMTLKKSATDCLSCTLKMPWLFYIKHFVYVGFISGIQGRETSKWEFSLSLLGAKTWTWVLFFELGLLFCVLGRISDPVLQEPSIRWVLCAEFPSSFQFCLASLGSPILQKRCGFGASSFLAIIKCYITNLSPCQENAFYLRIGNSLIVIWNICAQPLLGTCKSLFWEFYSLCSVKCFNLLHFFFMSYFSQL